MEAIVTAGTPAAEVTSAPLAHVVTEQKAPAPTPEPHVETTRTETSHEQVPAKDVEVKETTVTKE